MEGSNMQAGLLKDIIELYKPSLTKNEFGEQIQEYIRVCETKSQVKFNSGNRGISNDEVVVNYTKIFLVRYYIQVNENYQIQWNNHRYRILSIEENRQHNYKQIIAELINE